MTHEFVVQKSVSRQGQRKNVIKLEELKYWKIEQKALLMHMFSTVSLGRAGMEITAHN